MLNSRRLVYGSVGLFLLSLLLVACASTPAGLDDSGPVSPEFVDERTPAQIPTETFDMPPTQIPTDTFSMPPTPTAAQPLPLATDVPDLGPAPDIANEVWINAAEPLTLDRLRGKVVLVEFWTYG